jgi:hypothetical protein
MKEKKAYEGKAKFKNHGRLIVEGFQGHLAAVSASWVSRQPSDPPSVFFFFFSISGFNQQTNEWIITWGFRN